MAEDQEIYEADDRLIVALDVDSFDELKVYIELFASCGRSSELLNK